MKLEGFPGDKNRIVIKEEDKPVGEIRLEPFGDDGYNFDIEINKDKRQEGIATKAVKKLLNILKKGGAKHVNTFIDDANPYKEYTSKKLKEGGMGFAGRDNGGTNYHIDLDKYHNEEET